MLQLAQQGGGGIISHSNCMIAGEKGDWVSL